MEVKNVIENLVMLVPEAGKKLVNIDGKVVASNVVYVKEESMASAWAELDIEEADALEKQWQLEQEQEDVSKEEESSDGSKEEEEYDDGMYGPEEEEEEDIYNWEALVR